MPDNRQFSATWRQDGTALILGRLVASNGSGDATGVPGEGRWVEQADLSSIVCGVYEAGSETPVVSPSVTIASVIFDTPVTDRVLWDRDQIGYNFLHTLPVTAFPSADKTYTVQYTFTFAGGTVAVAQISGQALRTRGS